jgi:hypothetical protein
MVQSKAEEKKAAEIRAKALEEACIPKEARRKRIQLLSIANGLTTRLLCEFCTTSSPFLE